MVPRLIQVFRIQRSCSFFLFFLPEIPFFVYLVQKMRIVSFKLTTGTQTTSNMLYLMVVFTFLVFVLQGLSKISIWHFNFTLPILQQFNRRGSGAFFVNLKTGFRWIYSILNFFLLIFFIAIISMFYIFAYIFFLLQLMSLIIKK